MLEQQTPQISISAPPPAAPELGERALMPTTALSLDNPQAWLRYQAFEPPISWDEIAQVQKEIDAVIGTTRENQSIAKLVWNGDVRFWKEFHDRWNINGQPIGDTYKRPHVLYQSVYNSHDIWQFDAFPPRFLILTRLEPEQYADTWRVESMIWHPDIQKMVQILPAECPPVRHMWFMTIGHHVAGCCQRAAAEEHNCYGKYVHPRACLEELKRIRASMEAEGIWESHPFDSPADVKTRLEREIGNHDYIAEALHKFKEQRDRAIDETPLAVASPGEFLKTPEIAALREQLKERSKYDADRLEQKLKQRSKGE